MKDALERGKAGFLPIAYDDEIEPAIVDKFLLPFVLPKAAAHRSSILQDVEAGRRTEIDYLNGAVVRMGKARGIATPCNDKVASLVRSREGGGAATSST
jgi:ketopantoate reductase